MAKITDLAPVNAITGDEFLPIVQGGATKRATMTALRTLIVPFLQYWYKGDPGDTGPADSTYTSLAALMAAPVTHRSYAFEPEAGSDGYVRAGRYGYRAGDFSGSQYASDFATGAKVKLTAVPLNVGALVRQDGDSVTFRQRGRAAATRGLQVKSAEVVSAKDYDAIGDGQPRTVQEWIAPGSLKKYGSLIEIQADYPHVTSINDSLDWAAGQAALAYAQSLQIRDQALEGYGYVTKGGLQVVYPAGIYTSNDKPFEFSMNTSVVGEGQNSTLFRSTADGPIMRNDPVPIGPGDYNREGSNLRDFGIVGDPTKPNQVGLALLRWTNSVLDSVHISRTGGDGMILREASCNLLSNLRISETRGRGVRLRKGLVGGWGSAENTLPCNGNAFTLLRAIETYGPGISLEDGQNGTTFNSCLVEYCDGRGTGNTGRQIVITGASYVPTVFNDLWSEGANLLAHIHVDSIDARLQLNGWRHFALGTHVDRALVANGGGIVIRDGQSPNAAYPEINGSRAPFRIDPTSTSLQIHGHVGAGVSRIGLVEQMDGRRTGLFGALFQVCQDAFYGPVRIFCDAGSDEALAFYNDLDPASAWARFDAFRKGLFFGNAGIKRMSDRELTMTAADGGPAFLNHGSAWNGNHLVMGTYHLWFDAAGGLRIKNGAPAGDTDGIGLGGQA